MTAARHRQGVDHNARAAYVLKFLDPVRSVSCLVGIALQRQRIQPPHVECPDRKAKQSNPGKGHRIKHRTLEVEAVLLHFVDQARLQCGSRVAHAGVLRPQVKLLHRDDNHKPVDEDHGSDRLMASRGRRNSKPHLPPVQYCTISSANPPTDQPKVSIRPRTHARRHMVDRADRLQRPESPQSPRKSLPP